MHIAALSTAIVLHASVPEIVQDKAREERI
jgi:hypothetical protein